MTIFLRNSLLLLLAIIGPSNCAFSQFIYLANATNDVSAYKFNAKTRGLTQTPGSPFAAGVMPAGIAVEPTGKFVYVPNAGSNDVSVYRIEAANGALSQIARSPFAAGAAPVGIEIDPSGRFVYVANSGSSDISAYTIDTVTGALMPVPGSPFALGSAPAALAVDPTGMFLNVTDAGSGAVSSYRIDPATGALTPVPSSQPAAATVPFSRSTAGLLSSGRVVDRTAKVAFEVNDLTHDITVYTLDASTGAWMPVSGPPLDGRLQPRAIAISAAAASGAVPSGTALVTGFTPGKIRNNFTAGFGMKFTVGATPLNVTALGRIFIDGNTNSHVVKLVRVSDGVDVPGGSVTVPLPADTPGQFAYVSLAAPVTLDANASYYLTSDEISGGDQFYDLGPVTTTDAVSVNTGVVFWPLVGFIPIGPPNNSYVPVSLLYTIPGAPPTVAITAPAAGATLSGNNVTVAATATASGGLNIASVQFLVDNIPQGAPVTTSPYSIVLDTTKLGNGPHALTAIATDSASVSTTSSPINVTVNNNPTVAITAPVAGSTVSGNNVTVTATAVAATGLSIVSVLFKLDNVAQGSAITTTPYSIVLDSTKLTNGTHTLAAVATDSAMNTTTSSPVTFTVNNTPTVVAITTPPSGATVSGTVTVSAAAIPGTGRTITKVQFQVDAINQGGPVMSPYSIMLDTTGLSNGSHTLMAVATDSANITTTSAAVSITVSNGAPPPLGSPLITGFITGNVRNNFTGELGMKFTVGAGPLTVTALGRIYASGNTGVHVVRLVRVSDGTDVVGGSVSIQMPSGTPGQFAYVALSNPVPLAANTSYYLVSSEVNGGDQFYDLGPVTSANVAAVNSGAVSGPVSGFVSVGAPNNIYVPVNLLYTGGTSTPPSVAITAPAAGATVSGNNLTVLATATAATGFNIVSVQFQVDGMNLGAPVTKLPYAIVLDTTKLTNNTHTLTAVATDSVNVSNTSAPVSITVNNNPTVSITTPVSGATVSGNSVTVSASASAVTGLTIVSVLFKVDNIAQGAPVTTSPYSIVLDSTKLSNGPHSLVAVATDSANNTTTSPAVGITVANTPTTVAITAPVAGATVSGNVTVSATATAGTARAILSIQFRVDNTNQGAPVTTSPYSIVLDTTTLINGPHTLTAVAKDSLTTSVTSAPVSITVNNAPPPSVGMPLITGFTSGVVRNNFTGSFGMEFTVGATPLNVTALGRIYIAGNTGAHIVKLARVTDGADVPGGSVIVQLPSGTAGQFAYVSLPSPVTLDANTAYYLTSDETSGGDQFYDLGPVTATPAAAVNTGVVFWPSIGFISVGPPNRSYVPVNLLYTTGP